jgi:hypothetical protein
MRPSSKSYTLKCAIACGFAFPSLLLAQGAVAPSSAQGTCAGLLADNAGVSAIGPDSTGLPSTSSTNTGTRTSADTAAFGIGGARNGPPDVILRVAVQADQVRFARQPNVRVRLCWGGDTLRVVERTNIPSPVVAGTTYRNVYVAVELLGRLNGECLANAIGVGSGAQQSQPRVSSTNASTTSASNCAFLGGRAGAGSQTTGPPAP